MKIRSACGVRRACRCARRVTDVRADWMGTGRLFMTAGGSPVQYERGALTTKKRTNLTQRALSRAQEVAEKSLG